LTLLDPTKYQRPGWGASACVPVVLDDGREWLIPKPVAGSRSVDAGGWIRADPRTASPELDELLRRIDAGDVLAVAEATVLMLSAVYDIPDDAYPKLLSFRAADPANKAMWEKLLDVMTGDSELTTDLWLRSSRILAMGVPTPMFLEEQMVCFELAVKSGRILPAGKVVPEIIEEANQQALERFF
jgi:hypothetical protein